jgi:hypothetical protein
MTTSTDISNCSVCLEPIGSTNTTSLECGHTFHYTCIFIWNREHNSCPCCRGNINHNTPNQINDVNSGGETSIEHIINSANSANSGEDTLDEGNRNNDVSLDEVFSMFNRLNYNLEIFCSNCCHPIINCESCDKHMCYCDNNHPSHNGRNPFENTDPGYFNCLKCFHNRDNILLDYLMDDWETYIYTQDFIIEFYETFYLDNSQRIPSDTSEFNNYPSFDNYNNFICHCQNIHQIEMNDQLNRQHNLDIEREYEINNRMIIE